MTVDIKVGLQNVGPFVTDSDVDGSLQTLTDRCVQDVATVGKTMVVDRMARTFRVQRPYYRTRVTATPTRPDYKITDNGVVYGPWLEGTSRRNARSRFKGYHIMEKMTPEIDARVLDICRPAVEQFMREVNG